MDIAMVGPAFALGLSCLGSAVGCGIAGMATHGIFLALMVVYIHIQYDHLPSSIHTSEVQHIRVELCRVCHHMRPLRYLKLPLLGLYNQISSIRLYIFFHTQGHTISYTK